MRPVNRFDPKLPVSAMQTYKVASPRSTHSRPATCAEAGCKDYKHGWLVIIPKTHDMVPVLRQMALSGHTDDFGKRRSCKVEPDCGDGMIGFRFEAGQPCFKADQHRVSLQRPELYLVRGGDWRANTGLIRKHNNPEHWVEDMSITLDKVAKRAGA